MSRIGSLFSGTGMLDEGVKSALGGTVAWHSEVDPAACKVLAHRYPDVPNIGDVSTVDWATVEPVDVLTGGFPCQDVSHAGKRAGMKAGTRSGLWAVMCEAIDQLRPSLVVAENVRGLLSAEADSALEPCPGCVGDGDDRPVLRALGRVLGDLADIGYDARWYGLRAADVGAPHGRFRVFIVAHPAGVSGCVGNGNDVRAGRRPVGRGAHSGGSVATDSGVSGRQRRRSDGIRGASDAATGSRVAVAPDAEDVGHERAGVARSGRAGSADGRGPTPDTDVVGRGRFAEFDPPTAGGVDGEHRGHPDRRSDGTDWGSYTGAIRRWERITGRRAPAPTETGPRGGQRLNPRLPEWMMGWPDGWVCDVPGISRNDKLKLAGNGVVPRQCAAAVSFLLAATEAVA